MTLDVLVTAILALLVWKGRTRLALVPLAAIYLHLGVQTRIISGPESRLA